MKHIKMITVILAICLLFSACNLSESQQTNYFGFETSDFTVVEERDTHDGFLGDGSYYLILDCSQNASRAHEVITGWKELPLTDNLNLIMYGGVRNGVIYGYDLAKEAHWPATIRNGVYKFVDRHSESVNEEDDTNLLDRYSFNFSIAVYDLDTDTLYYFEMDT